MTKKPSRCVNAIVLMWLKWRNWYRRTLDHALPDRKRADACRRCEYLNERIAVEVKKLDDFFRKA